MSYQRLLLFVAILLLSGEMLFAKNGKEVLTSDPFFYKNCRSYFTTVQLQEATSDAIVGFIRENNENFHSSGSGLKLYYEKKSPGGLHFTFEQEYNGIPVFNSQVKVNMNNENQIKSIFDNSYPTENWDYNSLLSELEEINLQSAADFVKSSYGNNLEIITSRKVIAVMENELGMYAEIEAQNIDKGIYRLFLVDKNLNLLLERDLASYLRTTASALVFIPDPLTSAHVSYGTPYVDDDDNDVLVLNNQRMSVNIDVTLSGTTYFLENNYVRITEFSTPNIPPVNSTTLFFEFTRSQSGFEDVNAFYHISNYNSYVQSLGFTTLANFKIDVDAHAMDNADQSQFIAGRLYFGEGGVDDAEDADVVVHEYGHALSNNASPNSNSGFERNSIDEGLCDYLAAGYSKEIDLFNWDNVFSWDGHNEYWDGRTTASNKTYPDDLGGNVHINGEIWSSALIDILNILGRNTADKILFQSLYGLANGQTMKDAARLYIQADSALFQRANFCPIYNAFLARGLVDPIPGVPCATGISTISQNNDILIYDSQGFMTGGNLVIEMKNTSKETIIELFNADGKLILRDNPVNSSIYYLSGKSLPASLYVLKVQTSAGQKTERLVRIR